MSKRSVGAWYPAQDIVTASNIISPIIGDVSKILSGKPEGLVILLISDSDSAEIENESELKGQAITIGKSILHPMEYNGNPFVLVVDETFDRPTRLIFAVNEF